jgi:hypothetical protein
MDSLVIWQPSDALEGRCSVADVGTLRPLSASSARALARGLVPCALHSLARIAQGEGIAAVQACREILDRAELSIPDEPLVQSFPPWIPSDSPRLGSVYRRHEPDSVRLSEAMVEPLIAHD